LPTALGIPLLALELRQALGLALHELLLALHPLAQRALALQLGGALLLSEEVLAALHTLEPL
jgi:hypothetical protein